MWCHINFKCKFRKLEIECSDAVFSLTSPEIEKEFQPLKEEVKFSSGANTKTNRRDTLIKK
jgi:hypothetical protein